jgi:NAD-specific glutamate dehydrogenase
MLLLLERTPGKSWKDYKKHLLSGRRGALDRKEVSVSLFIKVSVMNLGKWKDVVLV